jgi:uncharacterized iron-regulated membrane protein
MRYLVQFAIPVLIFAGVVYLLNRRRSAARSREDDRPAARSDTGAMLTILALGAIVAIAAFLVLQAVVD